MSTAPVVEAAVECETFHRLEGYVSTDTFLHKLEEQQALGAPPHSDIQELMREGMSTSIHGSSATALPALSDHSASSSNSTGAAAAARASPGSVYPAEDFDYVLIDKQGAVEAMAFFIAEALMKCPEAYSMPPVKLQAAIVTTIQGMKQSRFKRVCTAGRYAYCWSALGYSAFQMYSNPWLVQAVITSIITFSRLTWWSLRL